MKIAYLTGEYPRATDTFIQREVAGLRAAGHDIHTCSVRTTGPQHLVGIEQKEEAANTFYILKEARNPLTLLKAHAWAFRRAPMGYLGALRLALSTRAPGLKALIFQLFYFLEAAVLARHIHRQGVGHLHNHIAMAASTVAMLAARLAGVPFSFTLHGPDIFFEPHRWRLDAKIAEAQFVACISHFCRSQAMVFADPTHWQKLHIVHCGVDPDRYNQGPPETDAHHNGTRLLFVGRLAAVKGVPLLLDAFERVRETDPAARLTLVGDGPERAALEKQAAALGPHVSFVGYKSQAEVADILRETDIFVLPSFAEGVPVVLMEALASGVGVVTTQIAGVPELVRDRQTGVLVSPGDGEALAEAICGLIGDPELREDMGRAGRDHVKENYDAGKESRWLGALISGYAAGNDMPLRPGKGGS